MKPKFPYIKVRLTGTDANAFSIMGKVATAMRRGKVSEETVKEYTEKSMGGDYNNILRTAMEYVDVT